MFKNLSNTTKIFAGLIISVVIIFSVIILGTSPSSNKEIKPTNFLKDTASSDNKVEALKTVTANLVAVESQNERLKKQVDELKEQSQQSLQQLNQLVTSQLNSATETLQKQAEHHQRQLQDRLSEGASNKYPIHNAESIPTRKMQWDWITDLSSDYEDKTKKAEVVLQPSVPELREKKPDPVYTIPVNATLTGASLMTPLVGRIPIDGNIPDPYSFKAILSATNLTANGYPLPGIKGAVISGVARGDMLASCARGDIKSITFVFTDGRISTSQVSGDKESLGYISKEDGNPCVPGEFKSNEGVVLGMTMGLNFSKGYATGIANSQYMRTVTPEGMGIASLIGSSTKVGIGEGLSGAAASAQAWWDRRVRNTFDFVFVPNWVTQTGQIMKIDINITQQINIDYDDEARKVSYEAKDNANNNVLD